MSRMFDLNAKDSVLAARGLVSRAQENLRANNVAEACRLSREAAASALRGLAGMLGVEAGSHDHGSLASLLNRIALKASVPGDIVRAVHILDPHLYSARRHGAEAEAKLGRHVEECVKAAERVVEWAASFA